MKEIFESTFERILKNHAAPEVVVAAENEGWSQGLWRLIEESGFTLALSPESLGGAGASWEDVSGVLQLCGQFALPLPLPEAMLANWVLGESGIEAASATISFGAENSLVSDGVLLSGNIKRVPWGRNVAQVLCVMRCADESRVVVLETDDAASIVEQSNTAGEPRDTLTFQDAKPLISVKLPESLDDRVLLTGGALLRSAQCSGALYALLNMASEYANERVQFGRPIAKFQAIQHQLAILAEQTMAARVAALAALAETNSSFAPLQVMAAKIISAEAAGEGAAIAHTVHGAIGFTHEYPLHIFTRRLWAWRSEFGSATYWSEALGQAVCAAGSAELWPIITRGALASEPCAA